MSTFAKQTVTGSINGTNTTFTFVGVPTSVEVYRNGMLQADSGADYTLALGTATSTVTFGAAPSAGDVVIVWAFTA